MTPTDCPVCDKRIAEAIAAEPERAVDAWQCPDCGARIVLVDQRSAQTPVTTDSKE